MKKLLLSSAVVALIASSAIANDMKGIDVNVLIGKGTAKIVNSADTDNYGIEAMKEFKVAKYPKLYTAIGLRYMYKNMTINSYDADANTFMFEAKAGYKFDVKNVLVIPNVGLTYSYENIDDNGETADGWGAGYQIGVMAKYKRYNFGIEYCYYKPHITTDDGLSGDLKNRSTNIFVGYSF